MTYQERRDMFAAHALVGLLAADAMVQPRTVDFLHSHPDAAAQEAFDLADAMLAESARREKEKRDAEPPLTRPPSPHGFDL